MIKKIRKAVKIKMIALMFISLFFNGQIDVYGDEIINRIENSIWKVDWTITTKLKNGTITMPGTSIMSLGQNGKVLWGKGKRGKWQLDGNSIEIDFVNEMKLSGKIDDSRRSISGDGKEYESNSPITWKATKLE